MKLKYETIWLAIQVQRGFIAQASVFRTRNAALTCERKWRSIANPDYDESAVLRKHISTSRRGQSSRAARENAAPVRSVR